MTTPTPQEVEELFAQVDRSLASTEAVVDAFRRELDTTDRSLERTRRSVSGFDRAIGSGLRGAFDALIFEGAKASDVMRDMVRNISQSVLNQALAPVQNAVSTSLTGFIQNMMGSLFSGFSLFEKGGVMTSGRVKAFAKGGMVNGPTTFPMRGGTTGLMGEAGPEAIMPLSRAADGSLGVRAAGGSGVNIVMNISTPDAASFQKSNAQIAARVSRAIQRGQRNL